MPLVVPARNPQLAAEIEYFDACFIEACVE
jgi:hypothetical protein